MTVVQVEAMKAAEIIGVDILELASALRQASVAKFERIPDAVTRRTFHATEIPDLFGEGMRLLSAAVACEEAYDLYQEETP